jgi:hypothetical protein
MRRPGKLDDNTFAARTANFQDKVCGVGIDPNIYLDVKFLVFLLQL